MTVHAENWVGEYTSTVGDGDIVLGGQIDGFCGFANVGDGVDVYYTIMDGVNKETGIATITGGKLVRKTIHAVLLEGTYIKGGSPLSLSGDAQVYLTANSHFMDYVIGIDNSLTEAIDKINALGQVTINGNGLQGHIILDADAIGARPSNWTPTAEQVGAYSKSASDQRYVSADQVETGEQPGKIMIVGGPRDKQLVQKIEQADQTIQQNLDDAKQTLQQSINNVAVTFIGPNPPQNAPEGKKWYDTNSGRSYIYLNDGDSKQWVEESPQGNGVVDASPDLLAIVNGANQYTFRNRIHNPTFKVNNRGITATAASPASAFFTDRWSFDQAGTGSSVVSVVGPMQDRTLPFKSAAELTVVSGITAIQIRQTIESANMSDIPVGAKVTFSAYVGSQIAGAVIALKVTGLGAADDYTNTSKEVAYNNTTFATTSALVNGSNVKRYTATFIMTEKMRNGTTIEIGCASPAANNKLYISGLQLEAGALPTALENRPISIEKNLCLRYYFKPEWTNKQLFYKNLSWSSQPIIFPVEMKGTPHVIALTTAQLIGDTAGMTMQSSPQAFFYSFSNGNAGSVEVGLAFDADF